MNEERSKILTMLSEGKISPEEAEKLLDAVPPPGDAASPEISTEKGGAPKPKKLCIRVEPKEGYPKTDRVKISIPLAFIRAGINLFGLLPEKTRKNVEKAINSKGTPIDFDELTAIDKENFIRIMSELEVDVDTEESTVKIYTS